MAHKTATDQEGIFYLRPLFHRNDAISPFDGVKYGLSESNFKVYYKTFKNPNNPHIRNLQLSNPFWRTQRAKSHANYDKYLRFKDLADIATVAMIVDRKTKKELTQNDNLTPGLSFYI